MVKVTWYLEPDFPSRLQSSHSVSAPDFPCKKVSVYTSDLEHMQKDWLSVYEFIPVKGKIWLELMWGSSKNHIESIPSFFVCKKLIDKQIWNYESEIWHR